ncbi:hypothetical protein BV22DRAFT_123579 [Leucogyrophana mollusca]|uniref:Uncharacterized protein n=1 Tax=Leucogyrophana mollusca TaxID=85980 RepID=A0ACB8BVV3_9AGAM|nr:hypothetical protein BV22DRAFT_123579 [Leucogyrophana mollusca]
MPLIVLPRLFPAISCSQHQLLLNALAGTSRKSANNVKLKNPFHGTLYLFGCSSPPDAHTLWLGCAGSQRRSSHIPCVVIFPERRQYEISFDASYASAFFACKMGNYCTSGAKRMAVPDSIRPPRSYRSRDPYTTHSITDHQPMTALCFFASPRE